MKHVKSISFTTEYKKADVYIITVPTPYIKNNKKIDTTYVISAVKKVLEICPNNSIIVIESTISPGTIDNHIRPLVSNCYAIEKKQVWLAHSPERIIPGNMIYELYNNSRTIGVDDKSIGEILKNIYGTFCKGEIIITDIKTAEMTKVVENTYRDINIAFANQLAIICRQDNMDVYEIIRIANKHPRVNILNPGPGVGGHCISVDPWFLVGDYPEITQLIRAAREINDSMPSHVISRIKNIMKLENIFSINEVGLYGLSYKENVDDTRESPTLQLLENLSNHLSNGIRVYDPHISREIVNNQYFDFDKFIEGLKLIVIMVAHDEIKQQEPKLKDVIVLDTRNIFRNIKTYKL